MNVAAFVDVVLVVVAHVVVAAHVVVPECYVADAVAAVDPPGLVVETDFQ